MFVMRTHGVVAATLGVLALGCTTPELNTDLRPAGPPEVLAVLVLTDSLTQLTEKATYCRPNDALRPGFIGLPDFTTQQVCPEAAGEGAAMVTNAYPDGWYVRIMFDELLDPTIEELTEILDEDTGEPTGTFEGSILAANPVLLECQSAANNAFVPVSYDGYYSPSGNRVTWPVGPSLVIKPNDAKLIATNKECRITLNASITDKDGEEIPADQRGPYPFKVAPIEVIVNDPADSLDDEPPIELTKVDALYLFYSNPYFQFNTDVQVQSICKDADFPGTFANGFLDADAGSALCDEGTETFTLTPPVTGEAGGGWGYCNISGDPCDTGADCPATERCDTSYAYTYNGLTADDEIGIGYNTPLKTDTDYTFAFKAGTKLLDRCGGETILPAPTPENLLAIRFHTNKFALKQITIITNEVAPAAKKLQLQFSNVVDISTLDAAEYSITPVPTAFALGQFGPSLGEIIVGGNYQLDTSYTFTLNAGATISDYYGATYTSAAAQTVTWKTATKLLMTTSSPADEGTIQKIAPNQNVGVTLTWNANMDNTTLTAADFEFVDALGQPVAGLVIGNGSGASGNGCGATSLGCQSRIRADLRAGTYKFTLKAGAQVSDKLGNVYTHEKATVINFTVKSLPASVQCL